MNLDVLSGGGDLGLLLYNNRASHHQSCKLFFSTSKWVSTKKSKSTETNNDRDQGDSSQKSSQ